ncbi:hypothetical protein FNV43_RR08718 [Rhamnella rubrinervis]|uniref:Cyclic nucleotide-binding domain-containing protein n=1 Tax=Rhamnella rubrinervis TaxID=2594499 RepID=A0A8K0MJM0_9ROSA|nr:hypothetical protein FNV43_RR08718 [Rhamnella rubrinervis]
MANLEEVIVSQPDRSTKENPDTQQQHTRNNGKNSQRKSRTMVKFVPVWNKIFALVCVVAVSLDPLFMYVPIINQKDMCLTMDNTLGITAIVLRLFTDLIYVANILFNVAKASEVLKEEGKWERDQVLGNALEIWKNSWVDLLVDFLAVLPIPQTVVLSFIPKVKGSKSLDNKRNLLNFLLLSQYLPRVFRIYLSAKELSRTRDKLITGTVWIRGAFNFFLYVLASHVFGAFWYFFSVQRETTCWLQACAKTGANCANSTLNCDGGPRDIQLLINSCPIRTKNTTDTLDFFDFGIFLDALESNIVASYDFPQKLVHCFWWGMRNLSSLGQNLETSTNIKENMFAASISMSGLLLFLYLIGNLQTYMQLATQRSEKIRRKMKFKETDIGLWFSKNGFHRKTQTEIMKKVEYRLEENRDVDVQNLFPLLALEDRKKIKHHLCFSIVKKVEIFKDKDDRVLNVICDYLTPVLYAENTHIIRQGDLLDQMLFITQGTVLVYVTSSHGGRSISTNTTTKRLEKGNHYGEELIKWSLTHNSLTDFPISTENVKSHTKVEAFALRANDLMMAVSRFPLLFQRNLSGRDSKSLEEQREILATTAVRSVRQRRIAQRKKIIASVEIFKDMDDQVLNEICDHLKPVLYEENTHIIRQGDQLDQMLFITQGTVSVHTERKIMALNKGDYYGKELVEWSLTHSTLSDFPISMANVKSLTKVEAFVLRAKYLKMAVSRFEGQRSFPCRTSQTEE